MEYYLAIDIGASSGRHILGSVENGKIVLKEIYRFENELMKTDDGLLWDVERLEREVKAGIKECNKYGIVPKTIAIDTWELTMFFWTRRKKLSRRYMHTEMQERKSRFPKSKK